MEARAERHRGELVDDVAQGGQLVPTGLPEQTRRAGRRDAPFDPQIAPGIRRDHRILRIGLARRADSWHVSVMQQPFRWRDGGLRSEEHTSELPSLMRISSAVFCLQKNNTK